MYFNTLIIMNEDALGYGHRTRKPSGYCKLTMPNKVSCYIQGLRQLPKGQMYKLYLISKSAQKSVEVGMVQVGLGGNKETRWVMNPENINNSGVKAQEIDGAFLMVSGDDVKEAIVPLVGFSSDPYIWEHLAKNENDQVSLKAASVKKEITPPEKVVEKQEKFIGQEELAVTEAQGKKVKTSQVPQEMSEREVKKEPSKETPREAMKEQPKETTRTTTTIIEPVKEAKNMEETPELKKDKGSREKDEISALREEVEKLNQTIQESKAIIEAFQKKKMEVQGTRETHSPAQEPPSQQPENIEPLEKTSNVNDYINNFIRKFQTPDKVKCESNEVELQSIFEKRIPINPFEAQNTGIKWVRITYDDLKSFSLLGHEWVNQSFVVEAHREFKHFILGRDQSTKVYYVGIPGIFDPSKQSPLSMDKIERFTCCQDIPPRVGEAGYWIGMI